MEKVAKVLGYEGFFTVDSHGHSGGIAFLWKNKDDAILSSYSKNHIDLFTSVDG